jgi:hypothetical protein
LLETAGATANVFSAPATLVPSEDSRDVAATLASYLTPAGTVAMRWMRTALSSVFVGIENETLAVVPAASSCARMPPRPRSAAGPSQPVP